MAAFSDGGAGGPPGLTEPLPNELSARRFRRSALIALLAAAAVAAVILLLPGLESVRTSFAGAEPAWIALAAFAEILSCLSYVVVFRAVFCRQMSRRTAAELGLAEEAANSLLSVGGAGGLALGAWVLRRRGVPADQIGRLTIAFFLITSVANIGFLVLCGLAIASGLASGPRDSLLLGGVPALVGIGAILLTLGIGSFAGRVGADTRHSRLKVALAAVEGGVDAAKGELRSPPALIGSAGYMLFDIAVLAICFRAFGLPLPPLVALMLAYIIGQLGGLVPLPGGAGGLDLGLIGALALYGSTPADATVAVLAYRAIYLVVPAALGLPALGSLRRRLARPESEMLFCTPGELESLRRSG
ncbi:MAG: flippase-like domain-containing protein [Actinobacteria bacterium]|nr:flippase-like domain-containing protein [Actinomycetota bacterium]